MSQSLVEAEKIVKKYMKWSFVGGLIPIPLADIAAVSGIQMKMLHDLSVHYGLPFKAQIVKSAVGTLLGSLSPTLVASGAAGTALKFIPVIGTTLGVITVPALSLATTYALGRVFITHFEAGGTLLDFDPVKVREHFQAEFEAAKTSKS